MEAVLARLARLLTDHCARPPRLAETPGAGAAGGLPFGLMAGANARLVPGFDLVSAWLDLERRISAADIVITGEGSFDATSLGGKGPGAVAGRALALGKQVHVFAGKLGEQLPPGPWQLHAISPPGCPVDRALREAPDFLVCSIQAAFETGSD
jgi:glycerate kinase